MVQRYAYARYITNLIYINSIHYPQIDRIKYIETERSVKGFIETLQQIGKMSDKELMGYANQSSLVKKKFNPHVWNDWMNRIEQVSKKQ